MSKRDFMAGYMAARRDMGKVAYQASDMENFGEYTQGAFSGTCLSSRLTNGQWLVIDLSAQINNA